MIIGGGVKVGYRFRLVHSKYNKYFDFYQMKDTSTLIRIKDSESKFDFNVESSKKYYDKYDRFLASNTLQLKSMCQVQFMCKEMPCILII